jgi:two-component system, response regulator PdtaR
MKVLIVEDESMMGLGLEDEIIAAGHTILGPLASTAAALLLARIERPAIAIIDLDLRPTQDGAELARVLDSDLGVPCVFLTHDPRKLEASTDSAIGVMKKPVPLDDISRALEVVATIVAGGSPPPPPVPAGLWLSNRVRMPSARLNRSH